MAQRLARLDQLVAGREQRHIERLPDREAGPAEAGGDPDLLRPQPAADRQHDRPGADILAGPAPVDARPQTGRHRDRASRDLDVLLHHHGVGAGRQSPAGQHSDGAAARQWAAIRMAGRGPALDQRQPGRPIGRQVGMRQGKAVDRDIVEGGHVPLADQRFCQQAPASSRKGQGLGRHDRRHPCLQQRQRLASQEARPGTSEAIILHRRTWQSGSHPRSSKGPTDQIVTPSA